MKHTPGPWHIHKRWDIKGADNSTVARVLPWDVTGCREEDHANANLIASAPELMAKLERFVKISQITNHVKAMIALSELLDDVVEVIAKAKGRCV